MKKLFSLILSLVMLVSIFNCVPLIANASTIDTNETSAGSGYFEYKVLDNGTAEITDYTGKGGALIIPSTLHDYTVTSIGYQAFYNCTSLTSVTLPNSLVKIGKYAFRDCKQLKSITMQDGVTNIGDYAFYNCTSLTNFTIPNSVTSIGNYAFYNCMNLSGVTISDSVTSIGNYTFYNCVSLKSITIPNGVTSIGKYAFYSCKRTSSLTIPDTVTSIGDSAFYFCYSLKKIEIPSSVKSIGVSAFKDCTGLTSLSIPNSVTSIGDYAFINCRNLTNITLPDTDISIGNGAFTDTDHYNNFDNWENDILYIGSHLIKADTSIVDEPIIKDGIITIADNAFSHCDKLTSVTIPDGVRSIGKNAFYACKSVTRITMPDGVTNIDDGAFYYCESLTDITLPDSVTHIGEIAFLYTRCSKNMEKGLQYIGNHLIKANSSIAGERVIKDGIITIADEAFFNCDELVKITIPNSVKNIGKNVFSYCSSLTDIYYEGTEEQWSQICIYDGNDDLISANIHFNPSEDVSEYPIGDVNNDNVISVLDATEIQKYLAGITTLNEAQVLNGDVNNDGVLSVIDATTIQKYLAGLVNIGG